MKGLRIEASEHPRRFISVFGSLIDELDPFYWLIDTQSGPFCISDKANFKEIDEELDKYYVSVPELADSSRGLWRPGILRFADLMVIDEWTYLLGIRGSDEQAAAAAVSVSKMSWISSEFFDQLQKRSDCALLHIDGWWEIYCGDSRLMRRFAQIKGAIPSESDQLWRHLRA